MTSTLLPSVSTALVEHLQQVIAGAGGWIGFDRYMHEVLYAPGLGYYARDGGRQFGRMPESGSDFVTAPELTPLFGQALARQVSEALLATSTSEVHEFGGGSGALAEQLLSACGDLIKQYHIVDVSTALRERQQQRLQAHGSRVHWLDAWPAGGAAMRGVVIGNEVLDAMPVRLLHWNGLRWFERGVGLRDSAMSDAAFIWVDHPTNARPPIEPGFVAGTTIELSSQSIAFVETLAERLDHGAVFFIDYGFPEREFYHPQRHGGTLMCHRAHRADMDPLADPGLKDITAHVDFTAVAMAAQRGGCDVLGYTSQGRFLLNCNIVDLLDAGDLRNRAALQTLINEHEMGELFKVIAFGKSIAEFEPLGFTTGDRTHRL